MDLDPTALAWAAGFLDGEGHFGVHNTKYAYPYPIISASQGRSRFSPLYRLRDLMGGTVNALRSRPEQWTWRASGAVACRRILPLILPYMCVKGGEGQLLYTYALLVPRRGEKASAEARERQLQIADELLVLRRNR